MARGYYSPMHQDIFGSAEKPFSLVADPKYFYRSASHGSVFDQLQDAIRRRDGFVLVTGDMGSGKTTVCRAVLEQLDRKTFTSLIEDPSLSEVDLLRAILQDFGLVSRDEMKRGRLAHASQRELIHTLDDFLSSLRPLGATAVLVIDEAQDMPLETLEQIAALAGPAGAGEKVFQIVLVGQPILKELLRSPLVRELDGRISTRLELSPLTAEETSEYISHRLMVAGAGPSEFAAAALTAVHRYSGGVPRLINMVCDGALLAAGSRGAAGITPQVVDTAAAKLELRPIRSVSSSPWSRKPVVLVAVALLLALAVVAAYLSVGNSDDRDTRFNDVRGRGSRPAEFERPTFRCSGARGYTGEPIGGGAGGTRGHGINARDRSIVLSAGGVFPPGQRGDRAAERPSKSWPSGPRDQGGIESTRRVASGPGRALPRRGRGGSWPGARAPDPGLRRRARGTWVILTGPSIPPR